MNVCEFVQTVEAAQRRFLPCLDGAAQPGLRQELSGALQQLEAARVSAGQDPQAARRASWSQVKVLHGLGYPIDFDWLHGSAARVPAR